MYPFKRILVPTDFSLCSEIALRQALHLSRLYGAEVQLLHVVTPSRIHEQRMDDWLADVSPGCSTGHEGNEPTQGMVLRRTVVSHPDPVTAIRDYVRAQGIDLVVIGTHGDGAARRYLSRGSGSLLGHTAEQVVRHAPCSVLTVGLCHRRYQPVRRILVPVDHAALSLQALAYARDLAVLYDAELALLHVIEARRTEDPAMRLVREAAARADLATVFAETKGPTVSVDFHVATGRPDQEIRRFVQQQAVDLIVQGAHADLGREALGDVAEELVRSVQCPVLTVRGVGERMLVTV